MKTLSPFFFLILITYIYLIIPASVQAQGVYSYRSGSKYAEMTRIDLDKPIGPGTTDVSAAIRNRTYAPGKCPSGPAAKVDSLISCSRYEGYTIKKTYTYSHNGNLLNELDRFLDGNQWINQEQVVYTYDHQGHVLSETISIWDGSQWLEYVVQTYKYNKAGLCTSLLFRDLMNDFTERISMFYDHRGNRIEELGEYWDGEGYVNLERWFYTYDKQGNRISMLGRLWDGAAWVDYLREHWTYYRKDKWLTNLIELSDGSSWMNYLYYQNRYNRQGYIASYTGSYWHDGDGWVAEFGGRFTYDNQGNMISNVQSSNAYWENPPYWIDSDSTFNKFRYRQMNITGTGYVCQDDQWVRGETNIFITFNNKGTAEVFADEYPSNQVKVYYSSLRDRDREEDGREGQALKETANSASDPGGFSVMIYPNPVSDAFRVTVVAPVSGYYRINLFNSEGKLIQKIYEGDLVPGTNEIEVSSIQDPGTGRYFLNAVSAHHSQTVKLVRY